MISAPWPRILSASVPVLELTIKPCTLEPFRSSSTCGFLVRLLTHWLNTENIDFVEAIDRLKTQINRVVIPSELLGENDQQEDEMMANENEIKEQYLKERMFRKAKGFAINKSLGFTEDYEEIYFEGETLEESIAGNYRKTEYWIYEPYDEQVFEDIDEALDYAEDMSGVSFEEYKKEKNVQ